MPLIQRYWPILFVFFGCSAVWLPAHAVRLALVVGNDSYTQVSALKNAGNDARLMASALRAGGFEVSDHYNLDSNRLYEVVDTFEKRIQKGDEVVFYFSGHGVQLESSQMLLPTDIQAAEEKMFKRKALPLLYVQDALKEARVSLLVIDACRDNPFPKQGTRSLGETRGLRPPDVVKGQAVIMSAGRGQKALDTVPGEPNQKNGLFTHEFVRVMRMPGLDVRSALHKVRNNVEDKAAAVNHEQRPSLMDDLRGDFVLLASVTPVPTGLPVQVQPDAEQEAWEIAKRRDTVASYGVYLNRYPSGRYAQTARDALEGLPPAPTPAHRPVQQAVVQAASPAPQPPAQASLQVGQAFRDCTGAHCPEMVVIPAGSFVMGSNDWATDEKPPHSVSVRSFALGKYEVTQGQWKAVMGSNPSKFSDCGDNCPVERVSWDDIQQYLSKLNGITEMQYRLPSEAEWEYAARAGCSTAFNVGGQCRHKIEASEANFDGNYTYNGSAKGVYREKTTAVGIFRANNWGLHDMHGNVREWVEDVWHDKYAGAPTDGSAWKSGGESSSRVLRGGSWIDFPVNLRSANRDRYSPVNRNLDIGFRLARTVP